MKHAAALVAVCLFIGLFPIPAHAVHEHTWDDGVVMTPVTCEKDGTLMRTCSGCGQRRFEILNAPGHAPGEATVKTRATCVKEGAGTAVCTRCGETLAVTIPVDPSAHDAGAVRGEVRATCVAEGYTGDRVCTRCGVTLEKGETVPKTLHDAWNRQILDKPACEREGTMKLTCAVCGAVRTEPIPPAGHTPKTVPAVAATCQKTGLTAGSVCAVCGKTLEAQTALPKRDHTPVTVAGKAATCTAEGLTDGLKCAECGVTLVARERVPMKAHTPVTVPGKAPTCTETGLSDYLKCAVCKQALTDQTVLPTAAHTPKYLAGSAPACTKTGLTEGVVCRVCGKTLTAQTVLPMTGHDYGPWQVETAAKPTEKGVLARVCARCGASEKKSYVFEDPDATKSAPEPSDIPQGPNEPAVTEPQGGLPGDADGDGRVTARDARLVLRMSARLERIADLRQFDRCDVDHNTRVTASDARQILRASARLTTLS